MHIPFSPELNYILLTFFPQLADVQEIKSPSNKSLLFEENLQNVHRRFARQVTTKKVSATTKKAAVTTKKATGTTKKATTAKGTTKKANLVNGVSIQFIEISRIIKLKN